MASLSLTTHFTWTLPAASGVDATTFTGGSLTVADTIDINHYSDQRFSVGTETLVELWSDSNSLSTFDFLWIEATAAAEIQLMCNEGGTLAGNNIENAFVVKLTAGVPFVLTNDDSRNMGNMDGTFGETQHQDEIDDWQVDWSAGVIDRIEWYHTTGAAAKVRVIAIT